MASLPWSSSRTEARRTARAPAVLLTARPVIPVGRSQKVPLAQKQQNAILIELAAKAMSRVLGFHGDIAVKGVPAPIQAGQPWPVERLHRRTPRAI